jgi:hypothetical protein
VTEHEEPSGEVLGQPAKMFIYPCGCAEADYRGGPLVGDCGDPNCYRKRRPTNVRVLNRAMRRAKR